MAEKEVPKHGDEVWVPSEHPDGHWVPGIVNSGLPSGRDHSNGNMLVAAAGHAKSSLLLVSVHGYGTQWKWPRDLGQKPQSVKRVRLDEVQG